MFIPDSELEGFVYILIKGIAPLEIEEFSRMVISERTVKDELSYLFYKYNMKRVEQKNEYPAIHPFDITENFLEKYKTRFKRLSAIAPGCCHYTIKHTTEPINQIKEYAKKNKNERLIIFHVYNLVEEYLEAVKIFKLNSFLYQRDINPRIATNAYSGSGFICNKSLDKLLKGKGKAVNDSTFKVMELIFDKEFESNLTVIKY